MVDERNVPISSSESNYGNINKVFFKNINSFSYPMIDKNYSIEKCAVAYKKLLYSKLNINSNNLPVFDLILLGMGEDGHTASLFPNTKGLNEFEKEVIKNNVPQLDSNRLTLTFPIILNAYQIIILAKGKVKQEILKKIKSGNGDEYPISKIINSEVNTTFILGIN